MNFTDGKGTALSLSILGYQFPEATKEKWDDNWLMVSGEVQHPRGGWRFVDACLTTFELVQLADWFDGAVGGTPDPDSGYFTEPCLQFHHKAEPESVIEVHLAYECAPPWLADRSARLEGITLRFPVSAGDLADAATGARGFLKRYPERGSSGETD